MRERGKFTITQLLSVILAVAGVILIIFLMIAVITPLFHRGEETAKSYFEAFVVAIGEADDSGFADFSMWQPQDTDDAEAKRDYFLVYFGGKSQYSQDSIDFFASGVQSNYACICLVENKVSQCNDCVGLKFPAKIKSGADSWLVKRGDKIRIIKSPGRDYYDFGVTVSTPVVAADINEDLKKILATEINFRGKLRSVEEAIGVVLEGYSNLKDLDYGKSYLHWSMGKMIVPGGASGQPFPSAEREGLMKESLEISAKVKVILDQYCGEYTFIMPLGYVTQNRVSVLIPTSTVVSAVDGSRLNFGHVEWKYLGYEYSFQYRRLMSCGS